MIEIHGAQQIADNLDHISDVIDTIIPIRHMRVVFNLCAALLAFALMMNMTWEAGFSGFKPILRLAQRCALAWLSFSLLLRAATPLVVAGKHNALIGLLESGSLLVLFAASLMLVAMNPEHQAKNEDLRTRKTS